MGELTTLHVLLLEEPEGKIEIYAGRYSAQDSGCPINPTSQWSVKNIVDALCFVKVTNYTKPWQKCWSVLIRSCISIWRVYKYVMTMTPNVYCALYFNNTYE